MDRLPYKRDWNLKTNVTDADCGLSKAIRIKVISLWSKLGSERYVFVGLEISAASFSRHYYFKVNDAVTACNIWQDNTTLFLLIAKMNR